MNELDLDGLQKLVNSADNRCFVCGPGNPIGLHVQFALVEGVVRGAFRPSELHTGWQGVVHGGIVASLLDEAMSYALYFAGVKGLTGRMEVRYRDVVRQGDYLEVEAAIVSSTVRLADIEARLIRDRKVVAEAKGRFMKAGKLTSESVLA
jgi:acyl-coenzyme A thioesterase PaaI-like protein